MGWLEVNWLSIVLAIIGIIAGAVVSFFFFQKGKREKELCYDLVITLACKLLTNSEGKRAVFRPFARKFCE